MYRGYRFLAGGFLIATMLLGAAPAVTVDASSTSVDAWIELSSTQPQTGCVVDVSVEIREAGNALQFADVQTALHVEGSLASADRTMTDGNGVAFLSVDTSAIDAGTSAWLDVNVGGVYLTGLSVVVTESGGCDAGGKLIHANGEVGYDPLPEAPDPANVAGSDGSSFWVPTYQQQRGLSCEFAALQIATTAWSNPVSEYAFDDVVGWSANPHWGFRGDINGHWGNVDNYGVYAEALSWALPSFGFTGDVFYGGGSAAALMAHLDAGAPVLVWLSLWGDESAVLQEDGASFTVVAGEHVVVAHGYDNDGVYVSDPGTGVYDFYAWSDFMYYWNILDGMGLAVYPA